MTEAFWYNFAYPLLQVANRVFTCTTTPPHGNSYFGTFVDQIKKSNERGDFFFLLINHSLACEACIKAEDALRCCHNLHLVRSHLLS